MNKKMFVVVAFLSAPILAVSSCGLLLPLLAMGGKAQSDIQAQTCTANDPVSLAPAPANIHTTGVTLSGQQLSAEQANDAAIVVGVARSRGLSERDAEIGLMVAMQETRLRNPTYGDQDSLGLFQQRPSQGWGTPEQVMDPTYAANKFYDALVAVPNRNSLSLIDEAMAAQRPSAAAYERTFDSWQSTAEELLGSSYTPLDPNTTAQQVSVDTACPVGGAESSAIEAAVQAALGQVGQPYVWGGESPDGGFDCSGLVWWAYGQAGINFPRLTAAGEYDLGPHVDQNQLQRGDLVFWAYDTSNPNTIHHVAIYLGNNQIIAAPHTGTFVSIQPMYWNGYIGATRLAAPAVSPSDTAPNQNWQLPIISSNYTTDGTNYGVDFSADAGTPVYAAGDGIVSTVGSTMQLGNYIAIKHEGGVFTEYAHLQSYASGIKPGTPVQSGQVIGYVGSTGLGFGTRLLFTVTVNLLPTDPIQFLRQQGVRP